MNFSFLNGESEELQDRISGDKKKKQVPLSLINRSCIMGKAILAVVKKK